MTANLLRQCSSCPRLRVARCRSAREQKRRLETAKVELAAQGEFDHAVVNGSVPQAAAEVVDLMQLRRASRTSL